MRTAGIATLTVDVGTYQPPTVEPDINREAVLRSGGHTCGSLGDQRGAAVTIMGESLKQFMVAEFAAGKVAGVIGSGGSGGTALITTAMRALGIGLTQSHGFARRRA